MRKVEKTPKGVFALIVESVQGVARVRIKIVANEEKESENATIKRQTMKRPRKKQDPKCLCAKQSPCHRTSSVVGGGVGRGEIKIKRE
jgi:hypothetical protein